MEVNDNQPGAVGTAIIKRNAMGLQIKQEQIFTNWANYILSRRGLQIGSLKEDMANGVILIQLVELLCDSTVERYNKRPTMPIHSMENITIAMAFLKKNGFDSSTFAPAEIAKGDPKSVLGFFWSLIAHFQLKELTSKWKDQGSDQQLAKLQAEIDELQAEERKRREAGDERKRKQDERNAKRKVLIEAQKEFMAKGNAFKAWAAEKTAELHAKKYDGVDPTEVPALRADLEGFGEEIALECHRQLSGIAELWNACKEAGAEETPTLLGEMRHAQGNLDSALEDARERLEAAANSSAADQGLIDEFMTKADAFKEYVDGAVRGMSKSDEGNDETLEGLKRALANSEAEGVKALAKATEMRLVAEKAWDAAVDGGVKPTIIPLKRDDLVRFQKPLEDALQRRKKELQRKVEEKEKELRSQLDDYRKWAEDTRIKLQKAIDDDGGDEIDQLMAIAKENDDRKDRLMRAWRALTRLDGPSSDDKETVLWSGDLDSCHSNVAEALQAYREAVALKEYDEWVKKQVAESKERQVAYKQGKEDAKQLGEGVKKVKQLKEENDRKRDEAKKALEGYCRAGHTPSVQAVKRLEESHDALDKELTDEEKQLGLAEEMAKWKNDLLSSAKDYEEWAESKVTEVKSRKPGTTPGDILRSARELEEASKLIRADNNQKRDYVISLVEEQPRFGTTLIMRDDVDSWHAELEEALDRQKDVIEKELKKAEEEQGTTYGRELNVGGGTLIRRRANPTEGVKPCKKCQKPLEHSTVVLVDGIDLYHANCFVCSTCRCEFDKYYWEHKDLPYCQPHYIEAAGLICAKCVKPIHEDRLTLADDKKWHTGCFCCSTCKCTFDEGFYSHEDQPYCYIHYMKARGLLCAKCGDPVGQGDKSWEKKAWHRACWVCATCAKPFGSDGFFGYEGKPYCPADYKKLKQDLANNNN